MLVDEAIRSRHSVKVFDSKPVPFDLIQQCLDLAVWAPNHKLTEPWHFSVVMDDNRLLFASLVEEVLLEESHALERMALSVKASKEKSKLLSAPVIVAVYSERGDSHVRTMENFAATAAAIQNLMLAAHGLGLGSIWRTGSIYDHQRVRSFLRAPEDSLAVGTVFLGYSGMRDVKRRRTPAAQKTYVIS